MLLTCFRIFFCKEVGLSRNNYIVAVVCGRVNILVSEN